jgi:DNA-binding winged helix-turn-helix (wHTH) protein
MIYQFSDYSVDDRLFEIRRAGELVAVERRVFDLILFLVHNRNRVVSKAELFDHLWQGRRVSEASLTVAMTSARKALNDNSEAPRIVRTYRGRGYRFIAEVTQIVGEGDSADGRLREYFVGRRWELNELSESFVAARRGKRQVCLISGEPGIGKSRLAEEFGRRATNLGARFVAARCVEADGAPPFWPWTQILRQIMRGDLALETWPKGVQQDIRRLLPDEVESGAAAISAQDGDPSRARFRLFDAVASVVRRAAGRDGLVVFIDDIHRADAASLLLLEFIAASVEDSSLVLLLADRDAETRRSAIHRDTLSRVCRCARPRVLVLDGLKVDEIGELVGVLGYDDPTVARRLRELTAGNPFFISQIVPFVSTTMCRTVDESGALPATVQDAIAQQIDGVSSETRYALLLGSVLGREFSEKILMLLCRSAGTALALLSEAVDARLIEPSTDTGTYRFRHILVRDVLYAQIPSKDRAKAHWDVAEAMKEALGDHAELLFPEIAFHRFEGVSAGDPRIAIDCCRRVGSLCSGRLAYEEAALQFERALALTQIFASEDVTGLCDLYLALGAEQTRSGARDKGSQSFAIAADLARSLNDGHRFASAAIGSFPGFFAVEAGAPDARVIALLREALDLVGERDKALRSLLLSKLGMALAWLEQGRERESLCREAWSLALEVDDAGLKLQVLLARWFAGWEPTQFEERWAIAEELMIQSARFGDRETSLLCRLFHVTCLLERGDLPEFNRQVGVFEDAADNLRQPEALWYAALLRAMHSLHLGHLSEADALSRRFAEVGALVKDANVFHSRNSHRVILAWELGALEEMVDAASAGCEAYPAMYGWRAARAWANARASRLPEARRDVEFLCANGVSAIPRRMDWAVTMAMLGEACVSLGDVELGRQVFELMVPLRSRMIVLGLCVATWGCASRYLGKLAWLIGNVASAESFLREAIEVEDRVMAGAWAAWSRFELSKLLVESKAGANATQESDVLLTRAREDAGRLGLRWLSRSIAEHAESRSRMRRAKNASNRRS